MSVHDLFRDRTTEPNSVLNTFLEPQKLDCRNVIHLRLHSAWTCWHAQPHPWIPGCGSAGLKGGVRFWWSRRCWAGNCPAGTASRPSRSVRRNPKDSLLVELRAREDVVRQGLDR